MYYVVTMYQNESKTALFVEAKFRQFLNWQRKSLFHVTEKHANSRGDPVFQFSAVRGRFQISDACRVAQLSCIPPDSSAAAPLRARMPLSRPRTPCIACRRAAVENSPFLGREFSVPLPKIVGFAAGSPGGAIPRETEEVGGWMRCECSS